MQRSFSIRRKSDESRFAASARRLIDRKVEFASFSPKRSIRIPLSFKTGASGLLALFSDLVRRAKSIPAATGPHEMLVLGMKVSEEFAGHNPIAIWKGWMPFDIAIEARDLSEAIGPEVKNGDSHNGRRRH
ncbi:hypothetical protein ACO34A_07250 [Rhizobium sp. ACO-34A]|nr:hypothetical protein ACO34A_07250 [Rhizobium sp. ACO-34A]